MTSDDQLISKLQASAHQALAELHATVTKLCPGPHKPVQHRDSKPPWCAACGRTSTGNLIRGERHDLGNIPDLAECDNQGAA